MTDEAMSPLRRRMIEDMTIRKLAPKTRQGYLRTIKDFAAFPGPIARQGRASRTCDAFGHSITSSANASCASGTLRASER